MRANGSSIAGTRGGPIPPRDWGVTTQRGDTVFVHVLTWPDRVLSLPDFGARVLGATMLADGRRVEVVQASTGITLTMPADLADSADHVIALSVKRT